MTMKRTEWMMTFREWLRLLLGCVAYIDLSTMAAMDGSMLPQLAYLWYTDTCIIEMENSHRCSIYSYISMANRESCVACCMHEKKKSPTVGDFSFLNGNWSIPFWSMWQASLSLHRTNSQPIQPHPASIYVTDWSHSILSYASIHVIYDTEKELPILKEQFSVSSSRCWDGVCVCVHVCVVRCVSLLYSYNSKWIIDYNKIILHFIDDRMPPLRTQSAFW